MNKLLNIIGKIFIFLIFLYMLLPILIIVPTAFNGTESLDFPPTNLSFRWFSEFFSFPPFFNAFFKISFPLAILAAILSTILSIIASYVLVKKKIILKDSLETFLLSPIYVPRVLVGMGLLFYLTILGFSGSFLGLLFAHLLITFPFAMRTVISSMRGLDPNLDEAAMVLGASEIHVFSRIILPLIKSGIVAGILLAFVESFQEATMTLFLTGPNASTIPVEIFNYLQFDSTPLIAAAATIQVLIVFLLALLIQRLIGLRKVF